MSEAKKLIDVLAELRKEKERKFDQTIDLIVNLRGVDVKRDQVNLVVTMPHKVRNKRVCGFMTEKSKLVDSITEPEFKKYSEKKALKNLVKNYDYFIGVGKLMPKVASTFGKVLGPAGKMPSPQLGILMQENEAEIKSVLEKISTSLKIRMKEASIKVPIGKLSMDESQISENFNAVYREIESALPKKKENVKNILIKTTMSKPLRVEL